MAKYKVLRSVAHNLGHSFLSDMNTVDRFQTFVPQTLFEIALQAGEPEVQIDFLEGQVEPKVFDTRDVRESAALYRSMLEGLVESMGAAHHMVDGAKLRLTFDLALSRATPRRPVFECEVTILDDRGRVHRGTPQHWWR